MQNAYDLLPESAKSLYRQLLNAADAPLYSFFCENWATRPELPSVETYLEDYALCAAHNDRAVKLPVGWFKHAANGKEAEVRSAIQIFPYDQIESCSAERFLQSCNVVIKLAGREVRIEKCQPPQADFFLQIVRAKKEKSIDVEKEELQLTYPVNAGVPVNFQVRDDGSVAVMFVKQNAASGRSPTEFSILVFRDRQVVKTYHFEARR